MKLFNTYTILLIAILALFVVGCESKPLNDKSNVPTDVDTGENIIPPSEPSSPDTGILGSKYSGTILAGKEAPYIDFNTEDYKKATEDGKVILLYFYSLQSGPSISDQNAVKDAFDEMVNPNIIGFRVNFDDDSTSAAEASLASELGIKIPRTKIIMKDGKVVQRSTSEWNANDYIRQITQYLD
jgi:hypothetical protein